MATTPVWSGAHNGIMGDASSTAAAGQVNQFLVTHPDSVIYQGAVISQPTQYTWGASSPLQIPLSGYDLDQPFTMSGTTIGRVQVPLLAVGQGADLLVSLCADNAGAPGTVIQQTRIPAKWIYQLSYVSGVGTGSATPTAPFIGYTGNQLAVAQFQMILLANYQFASYPTPAATGIGAASSCTWSYPYIVIIGGVSSGAALNTVFTTFYNTDGTLGAAIPQPAFPVNNDGSSASCAVTDPSSGQVVIVNTGGGTSYGGPALTSCYTATLNTITGSLSAWSAQAAMPYAVQAHMLASNNGYVYSVGGKNTTGTLSNVSFALVQNAQISAWTATTPLPQATELSFTVACNGYLFVIGGTTASLTPDFTNVWYAPILANGSLGQWVPGPALPIADYNLNDNPFANAYGIYCGGFTRTSCLPVTSSGPGWQWIQSVDVSGTYPGFYDAGNGFVVSGSQSGGQEWTFDFYLLPYISVPLPTAGLTNGTTYHVLLQQEGGDLNDYLLTAISHSTLTAGQTSPQDTYTWTALPTDTGHVVGSALSVFNNTAGGTPLHTWEDNGARITTLVYATTPDQRFLGVCEATNQGVALNRNQGFETGIAPWNVTGGAVTQSTTQVHDGQYAARVVPSGVDANVFLYSENLPCLPGQSITALAWMWFTNAVTGNASISINWYTSVATGGTYISTSSNDISVLAATYTAFQNPFTAPAGAYQFNIAPTLSGTPAASQVFYVDSAYAIDTYSGQQVSSVTAVAYAGAWPTTGTSPALGATVLA